MNTYTPKEERLNALSHFIGIPTGFIGLVLMLQKADDYQSYLSSIVFGVSIILLYSASTLYHLSNDQEKKSKLRIFDHTAIFLLIAGTYTPISLITLSGSIGNTILIIIWSLASSGIILKIFFTGKYKIASTVLYVSMGWVIILAIKPLANNLATGGINWMIIGGISYTIGAVLYAIKSIPFNHTIFHLFVLGGTFSHFVTIYFYVL